MVFKLPQKVEKRFKDSENVISLFENTEMLSVHFKTLEKQNYHFGPQGPHYGLKSFITKLKICFETFKN